MELRNVIGQILILLLILGGHRRNSRDIGWFRSLKLLSTGSLLEVSGRLLKLILLRSHEYRIWKSARLIGQVRDLYMCSGLLSLSPAEERADGVSRPVHW